MVETYPPHGDDVAIRAFHSTWLDALRMRKAGARPEHGAPALVAFDAVPPREHHGAKSSKSSKSSNSYFRL
ncbi:hypothetical protein PMO31116_02148 [Pandoraea morbifera]|uniref:Uncharacterized protein n=1 Tax=Pandoraea morbifera TaxID=2508300 RepID=A0A5E4US37_9BURK|nr:hypothetical protein [Pandoraea morbifera]VVE01829.1 hypothetical protein PMO31116_02148 [Pandoraea morbifera]